MGRRRYCFYVESRDETLLGSVEILDAGALAEAVIDPSEWEAMQ